VIGCQLEFELLDYPSLELVAPEDADRARGDVLAFVVPGARPAGNWISSAVPYLAHPDVAAVVTPEVAPEGGSLRERAATAVSESRIGTGSRSFRFTPGNLRFVRDFPTSHVIVRRDDYLRAGPVPLPRLCARLTELGRRIVYTPDSAVVTRQPPLFRPYLEQVAQYAESRGIALRRDGVAALRPSTVLPIAIVGFVALGSPALLVGGVWRLAWLAGVAAYGLILSLFAFAAGLRFRSVQVGLLAGVGSAATHAVYALALLRGLGRRRP
jgi:hypothetical protein